MAPRLLLATAAAAALITGAVPTSAADIEPTVEPFSWYITLFGGVSALEDFDVTYDVNGDLDNADADVDGSGFILGGTIGTHLTEDIRVELETSYFESDVDLLDFGLGNDPDSVDGKFEFLTVLANLWYDVPLSEEIKPYIGGGAGVAIVDGDIAFSDGQTAFDSTRSRFRVSSGGRSAMGRLR